MIKKILVRNFRDGKGRGKILDFNCLNEKNLMKIQITDRFRPLRLRRFFSAGERRTTFLFHQQY